MNELIEFIILSSVLVAVLVYITSSKLLIRANTSYFRSLALILSAVLTVGWAIEKSFTMSDWFNFLAIFASIFIGSAIVFLATLKKVWKDSTKIRYTDGKG